MNIATATSPRCCLIQGQTYVSVSNKFTRFCYHSDNNQKKIRGSSIERNTYLFLVETDDSNEQS